MQDVIQPLRNHKRIIGQDRRKLNPNQYYKVTLDQGIPKTQTDPDGEYFPMFGIEVLEEILQRKLCCITGCLS